MRRYEILKPMLESSIPPQQKGFVWVDIDEGTGRIISMKEMNASGEYEDFTDIISAKADGVKAIKIALEEGIPVDNPKIDELADGTYCVQHRTPVKDEILYGTITVETSEDVTTQALYLPYINNNVVEVLYVIRTKVDGVWDEWATPD